MKKQFLRMLSSIALAALLSVGLYAFAAPAPIAHAAPAASRAMVVQTSGPAGYGNFTGGNDNVSWVVEMFIADQLSHNPPSKPVTGPSVYIFLGEFNNETGQAYFADGSAEATGLQIDRKGLTSATLPLTTVPLAEMGEEPGTHIGPTFNFMVAATWTGTGPITFSSQTSHFRIPHELSMTQHTSGTSRDAAASITFSYNSPFSGGTVAFTNIPSNFAGLSNTKSSTQITVQH